MDRLQSKSSNQENARLHVYTRMKKAHKKYRQRKEGVQKLERQPYCSYINNNIEVNEDQGTLKTETVLVLQQNPRKSQLRTLTTKRQESSTRPRSAVGNVSDYRCVSDCRSRGHEFDPGPVPYFRGNRSGLFLRSFSSLPLIHSRMVVTSESICTKYWLTAACPGKKCCVVW